MKILAEVAIVDYIKYVTLSNGREKYYIKGDKVPKKYASENYEFDKSNVLIDLSTGQRVVKSKKKPNVVKIHGQTIWSGISHFTRSKIAKEMKSYFYTQFRNEIPEILDPSSYPIGIRIDVYDRIDEGEDFDNMMFIYRKAVHDSLCGNVDFKKTALGKYKNGKVKYGYLPDREKYPPKIIDDSKEYVQEMNSRFYPISEGDLPSLFIQIYSL